MTKYFIYDNAILNRPTPPGIYTKEDHQRGEPESQKMQMALIWSGEAGSEKKAMSLMLENSEIFNQGSFEITTNQRISEAEWAEKTDKELIRAFFSEGVLIMCEGVL